MESIKTRLICEFASSHNGDIGLAKALIDSVADNAPGSICKFQSWSAKNVSEDDSDKKRYQRYEFPDEWYPILIDYCKNRDVEFMTSIFNVGKVEEIAKLGVKKAKIASVCLSNTELLMMAGAHFDEVIASTAMATKEEIEEAADVLASSAKSFTLMHCVANYPCRSGDTNLERMNSIRKIIDGQEYASVGYSNHSLDLDVPKTAIAMGAKYVEVHFSLSRHLPQIKHQMYEGGPMVTTHEVSFEPHELRELATFRDKVEMISGDGAFGVNDVEMKIKSRYLGRYGK